MLVVIAEQNELKLVKELGYENYPVIITGVGGMNIIEALRDIPKDTEILNIGHVGSNVLPIGTIVEIVKVATNHEIAHFNEPFKFLHNIRNEYEETCCYTSTDFVTHTDKKEPCVFDMELAFICSMFNNVGSIKVVSDNLNKEEYNNIQK